jgi:hypothetical protein
MIEIAAMMNRLDKWRRALVSRPGEQPTVHPLIDEVRLGELAKWIAGAMTLLAALLTFLGMQGGALDRMLRRFPAESMLTFCLVGASVVIGVLSPAIREGFRLRLSALVVGIGIVAAAVAYALPNIPAQSVGLRFAYPVYLLLGLASVLSWRTFLAMRGAVLVVGLAMLTMGTYAAVKLSILSKSARSDVPQVSASVQRVGGEYLMQTRVRASTLHPGQYVVLEVDQGAQHSWLRCDPDEYGHIDETFVLPATAEGTSKPASVHLAARLCNADGSDATRVDKGVLAWTPNSPPDAPVAKLQGTPARSESEAIEPP